MKLFEMEGFLRGKCIPRDLKVNETNAEYLVRKFAEADAKCAALAAENAGLKGTLSAVIDRSNEPDYQSIGMGCGVEDNGLQTDGYNACEYGWREAMERVYSEVIPEELPEAPATDAFLAEVRAQGGAKALEEFAEFNIKSIDPLDDEYTEVLKETARAARGFAAKLRQEAQ